MNRLSVFQEDDSQILSFRFDKGPSAYSTIGLHQLTDRLHYCSLDPRVKNVGTVGPLSSIAKVFGRFHAKTESPCGSRVGQLSKAYRTRRRRQHARGMTTRGFSAPTSIASFCFATPTEGYRCHARIACQTLSITCLAMLFATPQKISASFLTNVILWLYSLYGWT